MSVTTVEIPQRAVTKLDKTARKRAMDLGAAYATWRKPRLSSAGLVRLVERYELVPNAPVVGDAVERASSEFYRGFLQGLFDAQGVLSQETDSDPAVRLVLSQGELLQTVQRMLLRLGIVSQRTASELVVSGDNILVWAQVVGLSDPDKRDQLARVVSHAERLSTRETFTATITAITSAGEAMVYDCSVPGPNAFDANGFVAHNCGEIVLRPWQFCNLSVAVARREDTYETLKDKVELAAIIGTIQSLATNFPGLRSQWKDNCEEERLLGVDINGQLDSPASQDAAIQAQLRAVAIEVNQRVAAQLGINQSAAVTCVKPSGNSSQLLNSSSGIHARWSPYYVRNVRVATHSPIYKVLRDQGAPMDPENGQTPEDANTWVIHFPVRSPAGAVTRRDRTAIQQCEYWLQNKLNWTEHNPSVTITYQQDEVLELIKWVWEHRDYLGGITFLPAFDAMYDQMPYMEIDQAEYAKLAGQFPTIDFSKLYRYEEEDLTNAAQELACLAGVCDVDFAGKAPTPIS